MTISTRDPLRMAGFCFICPQPALQRAFSAVVRLTIGHGQGMMCLGFLKNNVDRE